MSRGCICSARARRWLEDGRCSTCGFNVLEEQITPHVLRILCGGTGATLWRNARGFDDARKIYYGIGDGGADFIGLHQGRFLAVEMKTADGAVKPNQRMFGALVARLGGISAVVRSEPQAEELRAYLHGEAQRPDFVLPQGGQPQAGITPNT